MDSKEIRGLCEAYVAVYDEDLRDDLDEMVDQFEGIEELTEEEIDAIVEEAIDEMLSEGYEFDEVEEIFEEVLSEARVDMAARAAARRQYQQSSEKSAREARSRGAAVVRGEKRAEAISKLKGSVKSALSRAKQTGKAALERAKEAGRSAKFHAVDKPVAAYATKRNLHPAAGMAARSKDPEKRRGLRAKVAADIQSRIGKKITQKVDAAKTKAAGVASAAASVPGAVRQAGSSAKASARKGLRGALLGAARKLREEEEIETVDLYDVVLEHLLDEGYAETVESAEAIMVNMSEEWRDEILEAQMTQAQLDAIARKAAGKPKKSAKKIPAGMKE